MPTISVDTYSYCAIFADILSCYSKALVRMCRKTTRGKRMVRSIAPRILSFDIRRRYVFNFILRPL
jgi:hypothetical protein